MNSYLNRLFVRLTGNRRGQYLLDYGVTLFQSLMGIGAGACVESSGEEGIFRKLKQTCAQPFCIFDVGANQGQFIKLALRNLEGVRFQLHSFEPGLQTYSALVENVRGEQDIVLNNFGLGKQRGEFELHYDAAGSGLASLTERRLDHFGISFSQKETVRLETLDNYCAAQGIARIDLLKIDVEGHELDVLRGGERMFESGSVSLASFEFGGCNIDTRTYFQDFYYFFKKYGMEIFRVTPSGYLLPVNSYREAFEQFRTTNFLAVKS
ncbi:MAG: FkbM family methyltransferase [Pyrinomonadaceae bacterium]